MFSELVERITKVSAITVLNIVTTKVMKKVRQKREATTVRSEEVNSIQYYQHEPGRGSRFSRPLQMQDLRQQSCVIDNDTLAKAILIIFILTFDLLLVKWTQDAEFGS